MLKNKYGNYNLGKGGTQMGTTLQETPSGNRLHIGIFGKTNSGKSAFINAFSGQAVSIVADVKGTTTDPVYKAMEIAPLGPCVLIDTAGFGCTENGTGTDSICIRRHGKGTGVVSVFSGKKDTGDSGGK